MGGAPNVDVVVWLHIEEEEWKAAELAAAQPVNAEKVAVARRTDSRLLVNFIASERPSFSFAASS